MVWCRYIRNQNLFNVGILDFQIELGYRVFAIFLAWGLFWLLFKKCANFFQSSGQPASSNGPACLMQQKRHLNLSTYIVVSMSSSLKNVKIRLVQKDKEFFLQK
jgi:hypothetical protein